MREINWSEPLSDEDRAWAEQRPDLLVKNGKTVREYLLEVDGQAPPAVNREERRTQLRSIIADAENELARLDIEEGEEVNRNTALAGSIGDREAGLIVRDNTPVNGERPEGSVEAKETYEDERYWTKAKLTEELRTRNTEREQAGLSPLSLSGNRSELVERIMRDDEEIAADAAKGGE